mmetsp:Transcript_10537/g.16865  ORF Transcript_10537/g.16865 Transcript_10537/m.16865 type:complete len:187 (+) Transcript_10537:497-1057(+)
MMDRRSSSSPTGTPYFDCQPTVANAAACGSLVDGNVTYVLAGIHFHAPSENTRDGHAFPVEMHMVHQAADGALAVLGVLFENTANATDANPEMSKMMDRMTSTSGSIDVDTSRLFDSGSGFWRWSGSLTTPPCSEDVLWSLSKTVQKITAAHTEAFKTHLGSYPGTARPTQPLYGRTVQVYQPDDL